MKAAVSTIDLQNWSNALTDFTRVLSLQIETLFHSFGS